MIGRFSKVFIYPRAIDMRCGFEKLCFFIREQLKAEINEGHLYLFLGNNRKRLKILFFDGSGLCLMTKRMEKNSFMSVAELGSRREITRRDLKLILHGSVIREYSPDFRKSA